MLRQFELVEQVTSYDPDADETLLNRAYVYAMKAHGSQTRASGDPYFSYPLAVAAILIDLKLDDATIAAALLHDTIEDTAATKQAIRYTERGDLVGMFPEGRINTTGDLMLPGRPGAILVALKAGVPIVPCYITGSPQKGSVFSSFVTFTRVRMKIGAPIDLMMSEAKRDDRASSGRVVKATWLSTTRWMLPPVA